MLDLISKRAPLAKDDILVVGCVRNEALRLPDFLRHHRKLGVTRFLLIDNASDDGTTEFLSKQEDVEVYYTNESYSQSFCGITWVNQVLSDRACGHWTLVLDADELFIFPGYETSNLQSFARVLDQMGAEAVVAPMLDMYPQGVLAQVAYEAGESLLQACPYFDASGYEFKNVSKDLNVIARGGVRHRMFWEGFERPYLSPFLTKIPFIKWRPSLTLEASTHVLKGASLAEASGLLLHFKLLQDFSETAKLEAERKVHFAGARQYVAYSDVLSSNAKFTAFGPSSVRFDGSQQLVDLGLMNIPEGFDLSGESQ